MTLTDALSLFPFAGCMAYGFPVQERFESDRANGQVKYLISKKEEKEE